jgi:hypothetical protein
MGRLSRASARQLSCEFPVHCNTTLVPATFVNDQGQRQALFTTLPGQYASTMNGASTAATDPLTLSMYQTYLQPAATHTNALGGIVRLGGQTGLDLLQGASAGTLRLVTGNVSLPSPSDILAGVGQLQSEAGWLVTNSPPTPYATGSPTCSGAWSSVRLTFACLVCKNF